MLLIGVCRLWCYEEPGVITALPLGHCPRSRRGRALQPSEVLRSVTRGGEVVWMSNTHSVE